MLDRSVAPPSSNIRRPNLPGAREVTINDLSVTVLNQGTQPVTLLEIIVPIGRWQEPKPGVAYFLFKMLTEGTKRKTSSEIASAFDYYGSHLEIIPTLDHVSIKLYALNKFLPELLPLLVELLTESSFPENEFNTLKQIRLQQVRQQHARNNAFASLKFREMLFGMDHPYGLIIMPEQIEKTFLDRIVSFKSAVLTKPKVFLTGQISDEVLENITNTIGQLPFIENDTEHSALIGGKKQQSIVREDSTQASIRIGKLSIGREHPDTHQLKIANTLLGGFFGSRLMKNIREDKGLTYGIHASIMHLEKNSYWGVSSEVLKSKTSLARKEIAKEINKLKKESPSKQELDMVKNYMRGKYLSSFDSPFSAHEMIKSLRLSGLPDQYLMDFLDTLDSITPEEVRDITQKHLSGDFIELMVF